ncbi:hypothetical protein TYRP_011392 [Tyrophagus putrescentiae]|nr:hypothetical protein TYRP_011392 [Tyrophagus putrescentiae]
MAARLVILTLVLLVAFGSGTFIAGPPQQVEASILGEIGDGKEVLEQFDCLFKHKTAADVCHSLSFPFFSLQAAIIDNDRHKLSCCARLAAHSCKKLVTKAYCGGLGQYTAAAFDDIFDMLTEVEHCHDYQTVTDCTHPAFFFLLGILFDAFLVFLIFVVLSIFKCLCG